MNFVLRSRTRYVKITKKSAVARPTKRQFSAISCETIERVFFTACFLINLFTFINTNVYNTIVQVLTNKFSFSSNKFELNLIISTIWYIRNKLVNSICLQKVWKDFISIILRLSCIRKSLNFYSSSFSRETENLHLISTNLLERLVSNAIILYILNQTSPWKILFFFLVKRNIIFIDDSYIF